MAVSVYSANLLLNYLLRGVAGTAPSAWYVALFNGDPNGDGAEVSVSGYARVAVTFVAALNGAVRNSTVLDFGTTTDSWGDVTHWAIYDADTAGNLLLSDAFDDVTTVDAGTDVKIPEGVLEIIQE